MGLTDEFLKASGYIQVVPTTTSSLENIALPQATKLR
jgi:hypothetical protein